MPARERLVATEVTYTIEYQGKFYLVEHVPASVCVETGEKYFSPETVEHLQALIAGGQKPARVIETPVFEYA